MFGQRGRIKIKVTYILLTHPLTELPRHDIIFQALLSALYKIHRIGLCCQQVTFDMSN